MINTSEETTDEQRVAMAMKLYNDKHPDAAKIKVDIVGRDGEMKAEIKENNVVMRDGTEKQNITRIIENEKGKLKAEIEKRVYKDGTQVQEVEYHNKMVDSHTVGDSNDVKSDKELTRTTITRADNSKEVFTTYKDGDTGKKITVDGNNNPFLNKTNAHQLAKEAMREAKSKNR